MAVPRERVDGPVAGFREYPTLVLYPSWTRQQPSSGRSLADSLRAGRSPRVSSAIATGAGFKQSHPKAMLVLSGPRHSYLAGTGTGRRLTNQEY